MKKTDIPVSQSPSISKNQFRNFKNIWYYKWHIKILFNLTLWIVRVIDQGLIEKNSLSIGNVNMSTTRNVLGYYTLYRLLTFRSKLNINLLFVFDYNINHYNTLKMKKELFLFVFLSAFITLIDLGAQIRGT